MTTWAGRSSMEVRLEVDSVDATGQLIEPHIVAHFIMVARQKGTPLLLLLLLHHHSSSSSLIHIII